MTTHLPEQPRLGSVGQLFRPALPSPRRQERDDKGGALGVFSALLCALVLFAALASLPRVQFLNPPPPLESLLFPCWPESLSPSITSASPPREVCEHPSAHAFCTDTRAARTAQTRERGRAPACGWDPRSSGRQDVPVARPINGLTPFQFVSFHGV